MAAFLPNRVYVIAGIVILCAGKLSADEFMDLSPTTVRLKELNAIVEQKHFSGRPGDYVIRQTFLDPKTEEWALFRYATSARTLPEAEQLCFQLTLANASSAAFSLRLYDIFWDTKAHQWVKLPKELAHSSQSSLNDQSVFFACHPLIAPRLHILKKQLSEAASQNAIELVNRDIQKLEAVKGAYRVPLSSYDGTESEYRFTVSNDGIIERLECWKEGTLHDLTTTRVVRDFPQVPTPSDTTMFDQFSRLNVNDNGMTGLRLSARDGALIIDEIAPVSPAAVANMVVGEQVISVNGHALASPMVEEFRKLIKGPPPVHIGTRTADGQTKEYAVGKTLVIHLPATMSSPTPGG